MALSTTERRLARQSLVFVWLWTAFTSAQQAQGLSTDLLRVNAHIPEQAYPWLIWSGIAVDAVIGTLMAWRDAAWVYRSALAATVVMTVVGSWVDANLWLHPLGPLSKNLPILALLWILAQDASS